MLTQKESMLLEDLKTQEKVCAEKYARSASAACDMQLKSLFEELSQNELSHLQMLDEIGEGRIPPINKSGNSQKTFTATYTDAVNECKLNDQFLLNDLLSAEKHASSLYDTCVFEFTSQGVRDVLNYIQNGEQNHGKQIYDYMSTNAMY